MVFLKKILCCGVVCPVSQIPCEDRCLEPQRPPKAWPLGVVYNPYKWSYNPITGRGSPCSFLLAFRKKCCFLTGKISDMFTWQQIQTWKTLPNGVFVSARRADFWFHPLWIVVGNKEI